MTDYLVPDWPCEEPDQPFTTTAAHQAWQSHKEHALESCARKRAAMRVLADAKKIQLDARIEGKL